MNLSLDQLNHDLREGELSLQAISQRLGRTSIMKLAELLKIEIDEKQIESQDRDILKEWDFRYLGLLISAQSSWGEEERNLFKLLLKASLEGKIKGILSPPEYQNIPLETFGPGDREIAQRIRRHNLSLLKQMESLGLNLKAWLSPNETVPEAKLFEAGTQRRPVDT